MKRRARALLTGAVVVLTALVLGTLAVLSMPAFGGRADGERLARMQASAAFRDGVFVNEVPEAPTGLEDLIAYARGQFGGNEVRRPPGPLPVLVVDPLALGAPPAPGLRAFWMGHASTYVEVDGLRLLLDPVFAEHASPFAFGPRRSHAPPVALHDLTKIDAVLISHDHYDHLDMETVRHLAARATQFFVPLGVGAHLVAWGVPAAQIRELDWWQEHALGRLRIVCTPTRHYSGRGLRDRKATLWSSWTVLGPDHRFHYSGDTGYSKHFREIGERFGPFDIAFVKIGAYGPGAAWTDIHMTPESAVQAHRDLRGKRMFPVHWATFNLAFHEWDEPIRRAAAAAAAQGIELVTPRIGETVVAGQPFDSQRWWESVR